jgi:hypothetical protein
LPVNNVFAIVTVAGVVRAVSQSSVTLRPPPWSDVLEIVADSGVATLLVNCEFVMAIDCPGYCRLAFTPPAAFAALSRTMTESSDRLCDALIAPPGLSEFLRPLRSVSPEIVTR